MYIPPGFGTVTPYIFAADAQRLIDFLVQGLGGRETCRTMREDEKVANCQVALGTTTIMVSEASDRFPSSRSSFYLYVNDADEGMRRALEAGASLIMAVADMPYGDRQGGVSDPSGNIWWISQRLVEEPYHS
ncbi:MAG: VOC family protein [Allosphingosinicella sp.]